MNALELIAAYKTGHIRELRGTVAVVGAGNTAIDAANAARRLGAQTVYMVYRRSEGEMSAFDFEYEHAKQERVCSSCGAGCRLRLGGMSTAVCAAGNHSRCARRGGKLEASSRFRVRDGMRSDRPRDRPVSAHRVFAGFARSSSARREDYGRSHDRTNRESEVFCRRGLRKRRARSGGRGGRRQARGFGTC